MRTALFCTLLAACAGDSDVPATFRAAVTGRAYGERLALGPAALDAGAPRLLLLLLHDFGLSNRLRSLASAVQLARDTERELVVDWQPDPGCNATFGDLFDAAAAGVRLYAGAPDATRQLAALVSYESTTAELWPTADGGGELSDGTPPVTIFRPRTMWVDAGADGALGTAAPLVVLRPAGQFIAEAATCHEFYSRKSALYVSLLPLLPLLLLLLLLLLSPLLLRLLTNSLTLPLSGTRARSSSTPAPSTPTRTWP